MAETINTKIDRRIPETYYYMGEIITVDQAGSGADRYVFGYRENGDVVRFAFDPITLSLSVTHVDHLNYQMPLQSDDQSEDYELEG